MELDNKDIKMLRLIFNKATSDGERLNAINFIINKHGKDTVDIILNNNTNRDSNPNELLEEIFNINVENQRLNIELYRAKLGLLFWFMMTILMGVSFIVF